MLLKSGQSVNLGTPVINVYECGPGSGDVPADVHLRIEVSGPSPEPPEADVAADVHLAIHLSDADVPANITLAIEVSETDVPAEISLTIEVPEALPDEPGPGTEPGPGIGEWVDQYWWVLAILGVIVLGAGTYLLVRYWPRKGK